MAYSVDLRQRIVHAVLEQKLTLQQTADTFQVGVSTVQRYLKRQRQSGDLTAKTSPGRPSFLKAEHIELLRQQLKEHNDLTLEQRVEFHEQKTGVRVSPASMCRWVKKLNTTRKKDSFSE